MEQAYRLGPSVGLNLIGRDLRQDAQAIVAGHVLHPVQRVHLAVAALEGKCVLHTQLVRGPHPSVEDGDEPAWQDRRVLVVREVVRLRWQDGRRCSIYRGDPSILRPGISLVDTRLRAGFPTIHVLLPKYT